MERLLGVAVGCMGMSLDTFCCCTPSEFAAAWEAWHEAREAADRAAWERMRMQCLCSLQPYSQKRLRPADVMRFPWDSSPADDHTQGQLSTAEMLSRYEEVRRQRGLH